MPMAVGPPPTSPDRALPPVSIPMQQPPMAMSNPYAKDVIIAWFQGEFAAANAIIDALCGHLTQLPGSDYDSVFAAVHRRRLNWIPVLQMQKYHSIADVAIELRRVSAKKLETETETEKVAVDVNEEKVETVKDEACVEDEEIGDKVTESSGNYDNYGTGEDDSADSEITISAPREVQATLEKIEICSEHKECSDRSTKIKLTKGFAVKEQVKGHMVNVVKGLKLYDDVLDGSELSKLSDYVDELRSAGQRGDLSGETYILFNKHIKGNKREMIQFGIPIFGQIKDEAKIKNETGNLEPIPDLLQSVIDHLLQWKLLPEYKRPNSCIINFFDEGEYSQPFLKPPHLDQPITTLVLSETTLAMGRILVSDDEGNYKGPLTLSLKQGSVLVMRGNSSDMARHVICPSTNKRVTITFFKVRPDLSQLHSPPTSPLCTAMTPWTPNVPAPYSMPNGTTNGYKAMELIPKWEVLRSPWLMLAPVSPMVLSPQKLPPGGTGVFLPWTIGSRKHNKHLPPRAQKGRILVSPSPMVKNVSESTSAASFSVEGN